MSRNAAYLLHPPEKFNPGITEAVECVRALLKETGDWADWDLVSIAYDDSYSFAVQPLYVRILNKRGPILIASGVKANELADLRDKVGIRAVIKVVETTDASELLDNLVGLRGLHLAGQPLVARKMAIAILLVRKLRRYHYWAGKDKGYIWHSDLAKGRGVDERYADKIQEVANDLELQGILTSKVSKGQTKYALNPDNKVAVHAIADRGVFEERLLKILLRDPDTVSASVLCEPQKAQTFTLCADETQFHHSGSISTALAAARVCQDATRFELRVVYYGGEVLVELIGTKTVLIQVLEAFT